MKFIPLLGFILISFFAHAQCSTTVTVPDDITLCNPDDVYLDAQINGSYLNFFWLGSNGYFNNTVLSPTVTVNQTSTFVLQSRSIPGPSDNIIINGDFESGNTGFTSQYTYKATPGPIALWNEGTYAITDNPKSYHQNFKPCMDHTTGSGDMMVVNGAATLSKIWCQTVTIMPNTVYVFQAWAASVENSSPAKLQFSMNGSLIGNIFNVNPATCIWNDFYELWDSGPNTSVEICITNQNFAGSGNDFALDDIYFAPTCISKDSVKVTIIDFEPNISGEDLLDCKKIESTLIGDATPANPQYIYNWSSANGSYTSGNNSNEIIVNRSGNYTLVVIDENNCNRSIEYIVNEDFESPLAALQVSDTIDCSHATALISVVIQASNKSFTWNGPNNFESTDKDILVSTPGIYSVTIVNEINHCEYVTQTEVIGAFDGPQFSILKDGNLTCSNNNVQLSSNLIDPTLSYFWSGPYLNSAQQSTPYLSVNNAGMYSLEVTDKDGCSSTKLITVDSIQSFIEVFKLPQEVLTCAKPNTNIKSKIIGNIDSLSWQGPNGFASNLQFPLVNKVGRYYLTALDSNGCKALDTIDIVDNISVPLPTYETKDIDCASQKGYITVQTNDSLSILVNLINNETIKFGLPYEFINQGKYAFEVMARNGCKDTVEIFLDKNIDFPVSTIDYNDINCKLVSANVNVTSNLPSTYMWKNSSGFTSSSQNITLADGGKYYLTTTSKLGCSVTDSIEIMIDTLRPKFGLNFPQLSCKTSRIFPKLVLGDTSKFSVQWQGPNQFLSNKFLPSIKKEGLYTIAAIGENGCVSNAEYDILFDGRLPDALINSNNLLNCKITEIEKKYTSVSNLEKAVWHISNDTFTSQTIKIDKPGIYFLTGHHPISGCKDTFDFVVAQDISKPLATIVGSDTINCKKMSIERSLITTPIDLTFIQWQLGNSVISNGNKVQLTTAGTYNVTYQHPLSFCKDSTTFSIAADMAEPKVNIASTTITCLQNVSNITISGQDNYKFTFDKNEFTKLKQNQFTTAKAGTYTLSTEGVNGCKNELKFEVKKDTKLPYFEISNGIVGCDLKPAEITISQDTGKYIFFIDFDGEKKEVLDHKIKLMPGNYTYTAVDMNNGCTSTNNAVVSKIDNGPVSVNCDVNFECAGKSYNYIVNEVKTGTPPFTYFLDSIAINPSSVALQIGSGIHLLKVIDANGCIATKEFEIEDIKSYEATLPEEILLHYGESTKLEVVTDLEEDDIKKIEWLPTTGLSCTDCLSPVCQTLDNIAYKVILTDTHRCISEAMTRIKVDFVANVYYPNIFNPANHFFTLYGTKNTILEVAEMSIYDRWGNRLLSKKSFPINDASFGWDGTFNGEELGTGVYVFYAKVKTIKNEFIFVKGDITLVK